MPWPPWVPAEVIGAFAARGIRAPWSHQAQAADHARAGRNVIISTAAASGTENRALGILLDDARAGRPVHVEHIPARAGREVPWPPWVPAEVTEAFAGRGIRAPWSHQALAATTPRPAGT